METFSQRIKQEISTFNNKMRNCCAFAFLYGMAFPQFLEDNTYIIKTTFAENACNLHEKFKGLVQKNQNSYNYEKGKISINKEVVRYSTIVEIESNVFKCPHCREYFLRGVFFACGTASSPVKEHRLELIFSNSSHAFELKDYLLDKSLKFNIAKRNNKTVLYIKRCEIIEDFLAYMGANNSAFEMINSKINNEVRNSANRATNCDSANINKSLSASEIYINAINTIIKKGYFDELPVSLQEIARARVDFPDISIQELGKRLSPQISKSGVYHRLKNILSFYEKIKK